MSIQLMRRFFRERRRVTLTTALAFTALWIAGADAPTAPLKTAGLALALGLFAGLVSVGARPVRAYCESACLAGLAMVGLTQAIPGSPIDLGAPEGNLLTVLALWLGLIALARGARHALWALPAPRLRNLAVQARAGTRADIFRLWDGFVPAAERSGRSGRSDRGTAENEGPQTYRNRPLHKADEYADEYAAPIPAVRVLDVEAPFHIRLSVGGGEGRGVIGAAGVSEIFLVELGPSRLVLFTHEFPEMPLGRALLAWLDDTPGRMLDRRLAAIEQRAGDEEVARPAPDIWRAAGSSVSDWDEDALRDTPPVPEDIADKRRAS